MKKILLLCVVLSLTLALASCMLFSGESGTDKTPEKTKTYTVSFLTLGGSKVPSVKVDENDLVPMPEEPTKEGYIFVGWYTNSSYEIEWEFDVDVVISDIRLYAKWEEAHTHSYSAVTTHPTCTDDGFVTYTCDCGDRYTEEGEKALGHEYVLNVKEPDCTAGGYTTYTCEKCADSYVDDETPALGHSYSYVVTPPTCTEGGYTTKTCKRCQDESIANPTDAKGHSYEDEVTDPDCENGGYTTHTCKECGDVYIDTNTNAKGHTPGAEATCTEAQTCTVCGKTLAEAKGHTPGAEATCTEAQTCTVCGDVVLPSLGHAPKSGEYCHLSSVCDRCGLTLEKINHNFTDATCQSEKTCTKCGFKEGGIGDHSYVSTVTPPTCTEDGYTTHVCSVCNDTYVDTTVLKLGHKEGAPVTENVKDATCEKDGSYDVVVYCTVCKTVVSKTTVTEDKLGHSYGNDGKCENCGENHPDLVTITYVLNGGVNDEENVLSFIIGNEPTLYSPTHPDGYRFDGWYSDATFNNPVKSLYGQTGDIVLYAKWIKLSNPDYSDGIETPIIPF